MLNQLQIVRVGDELFRLALRKHFQTPNTVGVVFWLTSGVAFL
jgi:hypothetical protein